MGLEHRSGMIPFKRLVLLQSEGEWGVRGEREDRQGEGHDGGPGHRERAD